MSRNVLAVVSGLSIGIVTTVLLSCSTTASAQSSTNQTFGLMIDNITYPLTYHFTNGGTLNSMSFRSGAFDLHIDITVNSESSLELVFPRETADALLLGQSNNDLTLFVDDEPITDNDAPTSITMSCDKTIVTIPIKTSWSGKQVDLVWTVPILGKSSDYYSYSFMHILQLTRTVEAMGQNFTLFISTDSKRCDVTFLQQEKKIHIDIKGRDDVNTTDHGYFELWIPHTLLDGNYSVLIDGGQVSFRETVLNWHNNTDWASNLQFTYPRDATSIDVIGTTAVPEFNSFPLIVMSASVAGVLVSFRKLYPRGNDK